MKRARSIDDFVGEPIGCYYAGATHLVWCASPTLCGSAHWGRPSEEDARELTRLYELARHPSLREFDVYMDDGDIEHADWRALGVIHEYLKSRRDEWREKIRKHAVVVPSGIVAMLLAGMVPLVGQTHPMRFFGSRAAALEWLGRDDVAAVLDALAAPLAEVRGLVPVVRELRDWLAGALVDATVEAAAAALSRSPRTLQRELRQAGTSFARELTRARVRAACAMLSQTDEKVEAIARAVGCLTSSRLSALFKKEMGETPAAYRTRHRQGVAAR